ncbi:ShlB/FhaC/HecB family hemolysin secretion/activation protein [Sphingobium bisphenolivorans]|uniref:ShlB/FhaC/HecB family hemolysin secretion/activation protein n=1 Tax=Sphingobium bisphenolivorans TaxID=1335760 RepID=UPI0003A672CA|nr:ShlB/FhaC/HecB family hemolysin secretion/activation protein [Sphingobium bisphenolivorans]
MGYKGQASSAGRAALGAFALAASALAPVAADAQVAPRAPTREELSRGQLPSDAAPQPSRLTVVGDVERAPCPLADPRYASVTVNFADVRFEGLRVVDPAALRDSWSDFAGRDVPIASLCEVRDRAATALRQMGYLAAVQVPPQRIEKGGTVRFDIFLAKLVAIEVRGDAGNSEKLIAAHMEALKGQPLFNVRDAERHLLLARDLPGYDVRLALRPAGTAPGEVVGEVQVTRQRVEMDVNVQNLGSNAVGRFGGLARVRINDLTGMGDSTVLSIFNTAQPSEQTVLQAGHSMAIGSDGLRLSGDFTYAWSKPGIANIPLSSETLIATAALSFPIARRQVHTLIANGGLEVVNQDLHFGTGAGKTPLSRDRLRVLFLRLEGELIDPDSLISTTGYSGMEPRWRLGGSVELRQGLNGLGASESCGAGFVNCAFPATPISQLDGDPSAFVMRAGVQAEFRPVPRLTLALAPRAQYSPDVLLSYEQMSAGNYTVGRGYDPGVLTGDSGVGVAAEIRYGRITPKGPGSIALQPFAFFDAAWMWHQSANFAGLDPMKLYSAGGGVRATWSNHARLDVTLATPLRRAGFQTERGDTRLLFSLTTQILPWRR